MPDLSTIEFLLSQVPTDDGWSEFANELDRMTIQEIETHLVTIEKLLSTWPDHLRRPMISWLDDNDCLRLSFCRVFLVWPSVYLPMMHLPGLVVRHIRNHMVEHQVAPNGNDGCGSKVDISGFSPRLLGMRMDTAADSLLVLASYSPGDSNQEALGFQVLMRIDCSSSQATPLFALEDQKQFQRPQSLLLASLGGDRVLMITAPNDSGHIGVADLFLLDGQKIIFEHHWAGQSIRLPEIPQRSRASIFKLSDDQRYLWGYHFSGQVVRLDLHTRTLEERAVSENYVCDAIPFGDGLVLSLLIGGFRYINVAMKIATIQDQSMLEGGGQMVGWVANRSVGVSASAILEGSAPIEHTMAMLEWDEPSQSLQMTSHLAISYRRPDWNAPFLQFKVKRNARHWLCAYLSPPDFQTLHVHDLVTGKSAVMGWHSHPYECDAIDFDTKGEHLIFWENGFLNRWKFVLS